MDSPSVSRADELHYTYLDTFGRPVAVAHKENLVEQHIQDIVAGARAGGRRAGHAGPESEARTPALTRAHAHARAAASPPRGGGQGTPAPSASGAAHAGFRQRRRARLHARAASRLHPERPPGGRSAWGRPLPAGSACRGPCLAGVLLPRCTTPSTRCSCCRSRCWWWPPASSFSPSSSTSG